MHQNAQLRREQSTALLRRCAPTFNYRQARVWPLACWDLHPVQHVGTDPLRTHNIRGARDVSHGAIRDDDVVPMNTRHRIEND